MEQVWLGVTKMKASVIKLIDSDNDGWVLSSAIIWHFHLEITRSILSIVKKWLHLTMLWTIGLTDYYRTRVTDYRTIELMD